MQYEAALTEDLATFNFSNLLVLSCRWKRQAPPKRH